MPPLPRCVRIRAPAKVNLFLNILGKRTDGYHEIQSVFQMVSLYDELIFESGKPGISLSCPGSALSTEADNLVVRAARYLARKAGVTPKLQITLVKQIPVGSGLGGGSSDAAATLVALNRFWGLGCSREELAREGGELGSDVPFFLRGPAAWVGGRGDKVVPIAFESDRWLVLMNPGFEISTRWAYEHFNPGDRGDRASQKGFNKSGSQWLTNLERKIKIQTSGKAVASYSGLCFFNDLERVAEPKYPEIREMKSVLLKEGAETALMSGSGPTVFGFFEDRVSAFQAARKLEREYPAWKTWAVKCLRRSPF